jgi:hypothetical protein
MKPSFEVLHPNFFNVVRPIVLSDGIFQVNLLMDGK